MKTLKSLLMLCAGLSFCACNSDNEPQFPEGTGTVEVRIVPPTVSTRAESTLTGNTVNVSGTYTVTLQAAKGGDQKTFSSTSAETSVVTFPNVSSPTKVIVEINDGAIEYTNTIEEYSYEIESSEYELGELPALSVPAYGETTNFDERTTQVGGDEVTKYVATVKMAIPVARLEVGPITFTQQNSVFTDLTVGGVYLDKLRSRGGLYNPQGYFECQATDTPIDYQFGEGTSAENTFGTGSEAILKDAASGSFVGASKISNLPSTGVYAYNFFGATPNTTWTEDNAKLNPQFKIYFSSTQSAIIILGVTFVLPW